MRWGLFAGILWAFDTVVLSIALSSTVFFTTEQAIALASVVSAFLHDAIAAVFMTVFNAIRGKLGKMWRLFRSKPGKLVVVAACLGGPVGMLGYVYAVSQIGAAYASAISAFFPAYGALIAHFFLKERLKPYQWGGLFACLIAVAVIGFNPDEAITGNWVLGVGAALLAVFGWGTEANIISYALRFGEADEECCLQIRYITSTLVYLVVVLPIVGGLIFAGEVLMSSAMPLIVIAGIAGAGSYTCFYIGIHRIGAAKTMPLDVSYSAWTIPISFVMLGTVPTPLGIVCAIVIILGAVVAATDLSQLFGKKGKGDEKEIASSGLASERSSLK